MKRRIAPILVSAGLVGALALTGCGQAGQETTTVDGKTELSMWTHSAGNPAELAVYEQIIEAVHANFGSHSGKRALHAKGSWAEGEFTATPAAARLSRAPHLQGGTVTALVRFSNASGDPEAHDADRDGRVTVREFEAAKAFLTSRYGAAN